MAQGRKMAHPKSSHHLVGIDFLRLPPEIRNIIYGLCLVRHGNINILYTGRAIYNEAVQILYTQEALCFIVNWWSFTFAGNQADARTESRWRDVLRRDGRLPLWKKLSPAIDRVVTFDLSLEIVIRHM